MHGSLQPLPALQMKGKGAIPNVFQRISADLTSDDEGSAGYMCGYMCTLHLLAMCSEDYMGLVEQPRSVLKQRVVTFMVVASTDATVSKCRNLRPHSVMYI